MPTRPGPLAGGDGLDRVEGVLVVFQQIAPIFDADRDPDQGIVDTSRGQLLRIHFRVRGGRRMTGERFHPPETHRVLGDTQIPQEVEGRRLATDQFEREDAARVVAQGGRGKTAVQQPTLVRLEDVARGSLKSPRLGEPETGPVVVTNLPYEVPGRDAVPRRCWKKRPIIKSTGMLGSGIESGGTVRNPIAPPAGPEVKKPI